MTDMEFTRLAIGRMDVAQLNEVIERVKLRRQRLNEAGKYDFRLGERVAFVTHIRPEVLAGRTAIVRDRLKSKLVVDLERPVGKWGKNVRVPASLLAKLAVATEAAGDAETK